MIIVTTCAVSDGYGKLIMNGGSAAQAREVYPALTRMAYRKIKEHFPEYHLHGHNEDYGFLPVIDPPHGIGIFQTKRHWASVAEMGTIQRSIEMLTKYAVEHPDVHFRVPFPGSGEQRWGTKETPSRERVENILRCLPNNVFIVDWGA